MVSFEDLILIIHIWVPKTTIDGIMKKSQFKQDLATTFRRLTQNKIE